MNIQTARARLSDIRANGGKASPETIDQIWAALETVRPEAILGQWKGSELHNGHPMCGQLEAYGWYGKTFLSLTDAKPLIMYGEGGNLYSNIELGKGEASLWMVEFRGEFTATMVYDGRPIFDHFKKVDENTLMGVMNGKDHGDERFVFSNGLPLYTFILDRA